MEAPRNKTVITVQPVNSGRVTGWRITCSDHPELKKSLARNVTEASQIAHGHGEHSHGNDVIFRRPR